MLIIFCIMAKLAESSLIPNLEEYWKRTKLQFCSTPFMRSQRLFAILCHLTIVGANCADWNISQFHEIIVPVSPRFK